MHPHMDLSGGMSEEEQLALALAASRVDAQPTSGLRMAERAEAEAVRESEAAEKARLHSQVDSSMMRVAGDARGTASTLVGLNPEEAEELAMLQSRVAAEQPPGQPKPYQSVSMPGTGATRNSAALNRARAASQHAPAIASPVPLVQPPGMPAPMMAHAQPAPMPTAPAFTSSSTAGKVSRLGAKLAKGKSGKGKGLGESLLGSQDVLDDDALAPLQLPQQPIGAGDSGMTGAPALPSYGAATQAGGLSGYSQSYQPPTEPAVMVGTARGSPEPEWDDADRPLQVGVEIGAATGASPGGNVRQGGGTNVWGVKVPGTSSSYAQLD